jgi:hypothetical protein
MIEEAKKYIMEVYKVSREEVDSYPLTTIVSMVAMKNIELYDKLKKELRSKGYII